MDADQFWDSAWPGSIILEVVALRDLRPGEELFLDYGEAWQQAWDEHQAKWVPPPGADEYIYPEDMDDTAPLRTVVEQEKEPYPKSVKVRKSLDYVWRC